MKNIDETKLAKLTGPRAARNILGLTKEIGLTVPAVGFKPETIQYAIACIQDNWSDRCHEKLDDVLHYLKSKGVKSEADVAIIDEGKLGKLIGSKAARNILVHIKSASSDGARQHEFEGSSRKSDGASHGHQDESRKEMTEILKMLVLMNKEQALNNQEMVKSLQQHMEKVTDSVMQVVDNMGTKLTEQVKMQKELMQTMWKRMDVMENGQRETARRMNDWMSRTQEMNRETLMTITKQVNSALASREDSMRELREALRARPQVVCQPVPMPVPVPMCIIM